MKLVPVPIDERLTVCGEGANNWTPSDVTTVDDALAVIGRQQQGLDDCWTKMGKIRAGLHRAAPE